MRIQRFFLAAMAALSLAACAADGPTAPAAPAAGVRATVDDDAPERFHHTLRLPIIFREYVPCANGGEGEFVIAEGVIMERGQQHQDGAGQLHYRASGTLQSFEGRGETTGDRFTLSGGWAIGERIVPGEGDDYVDYFTTRYRLQAVGGGVVLHAQLLVRETFGEGTTPTFDVVVERMTCM